VDIIALASNHTKVVLHLVKDKADALTTDEVNQCWHGLYKGTFLTRSYASPKLRSRLHETQVKTLEATAEVWRKRLSDISWFLRALNEYITRAAYRENDSTGHISEGRFKSQALLDESDLAACMAYVDLNPVRAKIAKTPETSDHISIKYSKNAARVGIIP